MYPRFIQIILNDEINDLARTGATLKLQDPNVYKRIKKLASTSQFNPRMEFDILPWLLNDKLEVMELPASPEPEVEKEDDDEDSESGSNDDDGDDDTCK